MCFLHAQAIEPTSNIEHKPPSTCSHLLSRKEKSIKTVLIEQWPPSEGCSAAAPPREINADGDIGYF